MIWKITAGEWLMSRVGPGVTQCRTLRVEHDVPDNTALVPYVTEHVTRDH